MSSNLVINAVGLAKVYHIYAEPHHRLWQSLLRHRKTFYQKFHALRSIDFSVSRGETVGIVGRNGSGKSTLLQIICGTLLPSAGSVQAAGRISALLELGAGFNTEFTGRENVYMVTALQGLSREQTDELMDDILAFAEIGPHIDQPVKTYSSGMFVRLAFAAAIAVSPDILVVDEALAVGDEGFQRKCFSRIMDIKKSGASILFVSHSASLIMEFCDRAILLDQGEMLMSGTPKDVISNYHRMLFAPTDKVDIVRQQILDFQGGAEASNNTISESIIRNPALTTEDSFDPGLVPALTTKYLSVGAEVEAIEIRSEDGRHVNIIQRGHTYKYVVRVRFDANAYHVRFGCLIKTVTGLELGGMVSHINGESIDTIEANNTIEISFIFVCRLTPGVYFGNAGVLGSIDGQETYLHRLVDGIMFRVQPETDLKVTGVIDFSDPLLCTIAPVET